MTELYRCQSNRRDHVSGVEDFAVILIQLYGALIGLPLCPLLVSPYDAVTIAKQRLGRRSLAVHTAGEGSSEASQSKVTEDFEYSVLEQVLLYLPQNGYRWKKFFMLSPSPTSKRYN